MQEVALAAVKQQAPLSDASKAAPWLYRLAVTQALLYRRRMGRWRKLTNRYAERERPCEHDGRTLDPLDWLLADERQDLVRQAVGRLPRRDAEILLLKYTEHWSYEQLAQHLGVSESAIESRLHRARARLRRELAMLESAGVKP
jgi:RNA polymerase sigma-70 factor (ECF subfamily)